MNIHFVAMMVFVLSLIQLLDVFVQMGELQQDVLRTQIQDLVSNCSTKNRRIEVWISQFPIVPRDV